jgi:hypothetical protein
MRSPRIEFVLFSRPLGTSEWRVVLELRDPANALIELIGWIFSALGRASHALAD